MEPCHTLKPWNQMIRRRIFPRIHILCNGEILEYTYFCDFTLIFVILKIILPEQETYW